MYSGFFCSTGTPEHLNHWDVCSPSELRSNIGLESASRDILLGLRRFGSGNTEARRFGHRVWARRGIFDSDKHERLFNSSDCACLCLAIETWEDS